MLLSAIKQIAQSGMTFGTSGNASERRSEQTDAFWITPSGVAWPDIGVEELVTMAVQSGAVLTGNLNPSTEWRSHQAIYQAHAWIGGVVHLHSQYATVLSTLGLPVRPVHYQMARVADEVPVVAYQTFGTAELAESVVDAISPATRAVLVENHGLFAVGETVEDALKAAQEVEWTARIQYLAMAIGTPRVLSANELQQVRDAFRTYGQRDVNS